MTTNNNNQWMSKNTQLQMDNIQTKLYKLQHDTHIVSYKNAL